MYYSLHEIEGLHKKYAVSDKVFNAVYTHCQIVCDIALQLVEAKRLKVDVELVEELALLHDIGAYKVLDREACVIPGANYIRHGIEGELILKSEGFPRSVWHIAAHHTGVGLTRQDVIKQNLPLPPADYMPGTVEEELIMYADKFHSKANPPVFNSFEWYKEHVAQFGERKAEAFEHMAQEFGTPELKHLSKKYEFAIR